MVRFRRLLLADNEPMSVDENFIPAHRVPGLLDDEPPTSLYNVLSERYGLVMEWGEDTIEATAASAVHRPAAECRQSGSPLLKIQRHAFVARAMVDYSVSYYRADRYKLWVPLQRPGVRPARTTMPRGTARTAGTRGPGPAAPAGRRTAPLRWSADAERPGPEWTGPFCVIIAAGLVAERLLRSRQFDRLDGSAVVAVGRLQFGRGDRGNPVLEEPPRQLRAALFLAARRRRGRSAEPAAALG